MVRECAVPGCGNKMSGRSQTSFHRLPFSDPERLRLWLVVLRIDINTPVNQLRLKDSRVCGAHFDDTDFSNRKSEAKHWFLKNTAVPRVGPAALSSTGAEEIHDPNTSDAPTMVPLVLRSPAVPLSKTLPSTSGTYHGISAPADQTSQQKDSYNGETRTASLQPCIPFWGEADPDQNWVQCNTCLKWRKLADGVDPDFLPVLWFCHMNDDPKFRSCQVEEEPDDLCGERPSEKKYKQEEQEELQQKEQQAQNSEDSKPTPNTSATSLKHSGTQQRIGDAQTNLSNSSPLSCSGDDHSADSLLATSTTEAASPSSRMKRNLFTRENEEVKRAKMNDQQNSTSEAVASVASVDLCVPVVLVTITLKKKSMQVQTATQERDQCSEQVETVKQERDQLSEQVETVKQERDRCIEQVETVKQERDQRSERVETVKQERDQRSEQVKTVKRERDCCDENVQSVNQDRDQYMEQVEAVTLESDQYMEQVEAVNLERNPYRKQVEAVTQGIDQYSEQMEAVILERDQYREQMEAVILERDQYRMKVETVTRERDQYREQVEAITQERDQYRTKVVQLSCQ